MSISQAFQELCNARNPLLAYVYGSVLYGTDDVRSDIDVVMVYADGTEFADECAFSSEEGYIFDIHGLGFIDFSERLARHDIVILEGLSLYKSHSRRRYYYGQQIPMPIDRQVLRQSVSKICSNSFVKAKKKISVEEDRDLRIAYKSLFHSIRMYDFGSQIATFGYVRNFGSMTTLFHTIKSEFLNAVDDEARLRLIREKYKPLFNTYASEFKALCPK